MLLQVLQLLETGPKGYQHGQEINVWVEDIHIQKDLIQEQLDFMLMQKAILQQHLDFFHMLKDLVLLLWDMHHT